MVNAVDPFLPQPIYQYRKSNTKIAPPDIILDEETTSIESMTDYVFDEIGGQELLLTARSYTIDSPININNLLIQDSGIFFSSDIELPYDTLEANLENYQINLNAFLPADYTPSQIVSLDVTNGNVVIELENLKDNYVLEVKIVFSASTNIGTIDTGSEYN
jgi:hypothetical protein